MICLIRPDGGRCWVHESRVDEYKEAGFALASPPAKSPPAEPVMRPPARKKKSTATK